jgi:hypothetical protein
MNKIYPFGIAANGSFFGASSKFSSASSAGSSSFLAFGFSAFGFSAFGFSALAAFLFSSNLSAK